MKPAHSTRTVTAMAAATVCLFAPTASASAEPDPPPGPRQETFPAAFAYSLSHPTASPPGANDFSCRPGAKHPNPVVLAQGTFENAYANWAKLAPELAGDGYCVFAPNIGGAPGSPFQATGDIAESAAQFNVFVDRVLRETGASKVDIVGHSQGGMMPRYYINKLGGSDKVDRLVGLAPSNHGTTFNGILTAISLLPGGEEALSIGCEACAQQNKGSDFLTEVNSPAETNPAVDYTVVATKTDEVITPYELSYLDESSNVSNAKLQDYCAQDATEHLGLPYNDATIQLVRNALDPENARQPTCRAGHTST